jgi:hypothetical protein
MLLIQPQRLNKTIYEEAERSSRPSIPKGTEAKTKYKNISAGESNLSSYDGELEVTVSQDVSELPDARTNKGSKD